MTPVGSEQPTLLYLERGSSDPPSGPGTVVRRVPAGPAAKRQIVIDVAELTDPANLRKAGRTFVTWLVTLLIGGVLVAYMVGPLFALHTQRDLTQGMQLAVSQAVGAVSNSLEGAAPVIRATPIGEPVAVIQIPALKLQQTVAEGAGPEVLRGGAGHVPGTAGIGQPGNSVVVARRHAFGGPFDDLSLLKAGDQIIVLTTQGRSLYTVTTVGKPPVNINTYDPTDTDQLVLMTAPGRWPPSTDHALSVLAELAGKPYVPTPQNGFSTEQDGRHGDSSAWPLLILELMGLAVTIAVAMTLYRRWSAPATYLITTPALLALVIFVTLTGSRLLPGWV